MTGLALFRADRVLLGLAGIQLLSVHSKRILASQLLLSTYGKLTDTFDVAGVCATWIFGSDLFFSRWRVALYARGRHLTVSF